MAPPDTPRPPRQKLSSSSGAFAAINPAKTAQAVAELQDWAEVVDAKLKVAFNRFEHGEEEQERNYERIVERIAPLVTLTENLRNEVAELNEFVARTEGQRSTFEMAWKIIPTLIAIASLVWAILGKR